MNVRLQIPVDLHRLAVESAEQLMASAGDDDDVRSVVGYYQSAHIVWQRAALQLIAFANSRARGQ